MSWDEPDFTLPVSILAQEIESLAVDIKAQTIGNLNVNIASQAPNLNLNVNIAAATATVNVNVTNSSLNVNITNSSLNVNVTNSSVNIIFSDQIKPVVEQKDWSAQQAQDVSLNTFTSIPRDGNLHVVITYTVPSDKDLYITEISYGMLGESLLETTNGRRSGIYCEIFDNSTGNRLYTNCSNLGYAISFNKPIKVPRGHQIYVRLGTYDVAGGNANSAVSLGGYLK